MESVSTIETKKTEPESQSLQHAPVGGGSQTYLAPSTQEETILQVSKPQKHVGEMLETHGRTLVEKIVGSDSANAQAHLYRTLVEFTIPKPESKVSITAGGVFLNVREVE